MPLPESVLDIIQLADVAFHPCKLGLAKRGLLKQRDIAKASGIHEVRISEIFRSARRLPTEEEKRTLASLAGMSVAEAFPDRTLDAAKSARVGDVLKGLPKEAVSVVLATEILERVCKAVGMSAAEQEQVVARFTSAAVEKLQR